MNQLQVILLLTLCCWTCCWAYNRYEPSYVHFELESDEDDDDDDNQGKPYGFQYDVNDGHENNFGHWQQSDGQVTTGSYRVQLPDGRTQIVTYRADENGYNAQVTYVEPTTGAAIKRLSYRTTTTTTTAAPPARPLYEFPGIPPYHGPSHHGAYHQQSISSSSSSSNSYATTTPTSGAAAAPYYPSEDDGSDESITAENPTRLLFRTNVEKINNNLYGDISRIPLVHHRSTSFNSKRSPPPSSMSSLEQPQPPQGAAVHISKAFDPREQFQNENDKQVESRQSDDSSSTDFNDFHHLPFPLPVPLAFRPV